MLKKIVTLKKNISFAKTICDYKEFVTEIFCDIKFKICDDKCQF